MGVYTQYDPTATRRGRAPGMGDGSEPPIGRDRDPDRGKPKPPDKPGYPYQHGTGTFIGDPNNKFPEPPPPRPTPEMLDRARNGEETDEEREVIRNWRSYAARKGEWEMKELESGRVPYMKKSSYDMIQTYGDVGITNMDIQNGYMWDTRQGQPSDRYPDGKTPAGGGWVKMSSEQWKAVRDFNKWTFDSPFGQRATQAWGGNAYGAKHFQDWATKGWGLKYGHVTWDPKAGIFYSYHGPGNGTPYGNYSFKDKYGIKIGMPKGWVPPTMGKTGMEPNHYELNDPNAPAYPDSGYEFPDWTPPAETVMSQDPIGAYDPPPPTPFGATTSSLYGKGTNYGWGGAWGGAYGGGTSYGAPAQRTGVAATAAPANTTTPTSAKPVQDPNLTRLATTPPKGSAPGMGAVNASLPTGTVGPSARRKIMPPPQMTAPTPLPGMGAMPATNYYRQKRPVLI